jgi:hypothetical protein
MVPLLMHSGVDIRWFSVCWRWAAAGETGKKTKKEPTQNIKQVFLAASLVSNNPGHGVTLEFAA